MIRLDYSNKVGAIEKASFAFLTLGKEKEGYNFLKYWLKNPEEPKDDTYKTLPKGDWLKLEGQDMYEDIFETEPDFGAFLARYVCMGNILALLAYKIRCLNELKKNESSVEKLDKSLGEVKSDSPGGKVKKVGNFNVQLK